MVSDMQTARYRYHFEEESTCIQKLAYLRDPHLCMEDNYQYDRLTIPYRRPCSVGKRIPTLYKCYLPGLIHKKVTR